MAKLLKQKKSQQKIIGPGYSQAQLSMKMEKQQSIQLAKTLQQVMKQKYMVTM